VTFITKKINNQNKYKAKPRLWTRFFLKERKSVPQKKLARSKVSK
jgi:hypothetical protein